MQPSYIPTKDSNFDAWLTNFSTLLTANPTDYGLVAGDATVVAAAQAAYHPAFLAATTPETRTAPTIAEKDSQRTSAVEVVRPYAIAISLNSSVSDELKVGIGVNLPNRTRPRIPPPLTNPDLTHVDSIPGSATMGYHDSATPLTKAKPVGVTALELRRTLGTAPATDPDAAVFQDMITKSPFTAVFDAADRGKVVTFWGRWRTKSGPAGVSQYGPWSPALSFIAT